MAAAERVSKFFDDATKLLTASTKQANKVGAEMNKLSTWLQKHQNETLPEGPKGKLMQTVEMYYRQCNVGEWREALLDALSNLLSTYLQMPEGKLLSAKDKKKVLNWLQSLSGDPSNTSPDPLVEESSSISTWSVESVEKGQRVTLLNTANAELWKENFKVVDKAMYAEITKLLEGGEVEVVLVDFDEESNAITRVYSS